MIEGVFKHIKGEGCALPKRGVLSTGKALNISFKENLAMKLTMLPLSH
ncbi:hypothetical protein [Pontibacter mucosus]|nr:hypothetical protein [Pontibacter mucosus]